MSGRRGAIATLAVWLAASAGSALAQAPPVPPRIWDIPFGTHVDDLPTGEFVSPACGTNGGPPGMPLRSFADFANCRPEPSGLREVWFIYDDERELIYRALAPSLRFADADNINEDLLVQRFSATEVNLQPVIISFLIDDAGRVRGYRIFTDPAADPDLRAGAASAGVVFKARFGLDGWVCENLPPAEGETPIGTAPFDRFIKERCEMRLADRQVIVETRNYYKRGQTYINPVSQQANINQFESSASLQVYELPR